MEKACFPSHDSFRTLMKQNPLLDLAMAAGSQALHCRLPSSIPSSVDVATRCFGIAGKA
jgi:hypothetical protein